MWIWISMEVWIFMARIKGAVVSRIGMETRSRLDLLVVMDEIVLKEKGAS